MAKACESRPMFVIRMKAKTDATKARLEELRARLEKLDAERAAVAAEIHRLAEPGSILPAPTVVKKDPIAGADEKDWHVFAGPPPNKIRKPKA